MATNPFEQPLPSKHRDSVDHMQAIQFVFDNPNWVMNVVWTGLCLLSGFMIPFIGQFVLQGYQFAIIEALHLRPGETYPDFDFDDFGDYLVNGVWGFLATLVMSLLISLLVGVVFAFVAIAAAIAGAAGGEEAAAVAMMIVVPLAFVAGIILYMGSIMMIVPIVLRAGLTRSFSDAFDFQFAWQFMKNTWVQMFVSGIVFMCVVLVLEILGALMFCVGIFFTLGFAMLIQAHLGLQLYEVHLARGGEPIPIPPRSR